MVGSPLRLDRQSAKSLRQASRQQKRAAQKRTSALVKGPVEAVAAPVARPAWRGWRGRGGGIVPALEPAPEFRGTTVQVCGLFPFAAGSNPPLVGTPMGRSLVNGGTICADPLSWFLAGLIDTPSAFIMGRPGKGKSSAARRMLIGMMHRGAVPLIMADLKPDYVRLIRRVEGHVVEISRSRGSINLFDPGPVLGLLEKLPPESQRALSLEIRGRQTGTAVALIEMVAQRPLDPRHRTLLMTALKLLDEEDQVAVPLVDQVLAKLRSRHPALRSVALDRGEDARYTAVIEPLEEGLIALGPEGPFGRIFCEPTSEPVRIGVPTVIDVSRIADEDDPILLAAVQAVCWSYGASVVSAVKTAVDHKVMDDVTYVIVMDELWRALRAWPGIVDLVDANSRTNRQKHIAEIKLTHTMLDLKLDTDTATARASGFVERSGMLLLGGLSKSEMGNLRTVYDMTQREVDYLLSWSDEAQPGPDGRVTHTPGRGCFLLKVGKSPGRPLEIQQTRSEVWINDTNARWDGMRAHDDRPPDADHYADAAAPR